MDIRGRASSSLATFAPANPANWAGGVVLALLLAPIGIAMGFSRTYTYLTLIVAASVISRFLGKTRYRWWLLVPLVATFLAFLQHRVGHIWIDGAIVVGVFYLGLRFGSASKDGDIYRFLRYLTYIAGASSVIAVYEYLHKAPLYQYSPFQDLRPFRATGMMTHPLILSTVACAVITANLAISTKNRSRLLIAVILPILGAAATVSRTSAYLLPAGLLAVALLRSSGTKGKRWSRLGVVIGVVTAVLVFTDLGAGLSTRFQELNTSTQVVRVQALSVTEAITNGYQNVIGGGPGYVAAAINASPSLSDDLLGYATVDNGFLGIFADYGAIGFVGFILAGALLVGTLWRRNASYAQRAAAILGLVVFLSNFSYEATGWPPIAFLTAWAIGACAPRPKTKSETPAPAQSQPRMRPRELSST